MSSRPVCPVCTSPLVAGMCRRCAFSTALAGLNVETPPARSAADEDVPEGFVLLREIGAGATAVVWLARDQQLDRLVALKLISGADRRLMQRLVREAQAAARLRHPHIVAVHALRATERQAYLSMDLMEGGDLRARLASGLPPPCTAADWVRKLADALGHAHANSILHRDIKPSNVLLNAEGEPHLADFGLAAPLEGAGDLTLPGQVAGTAAYLAPELLAGANHASPLSDLYSLGAVLYECLTGRAPFGGDSAAAIFAQLASSEPVAPRLLRADIPRDLETICLKCLEKTPARRYASARALEDDLERFLRGEPIAARPVTRIEKTFRWCRRRPAAAALASVTTLSVLSLAIGGPLVALRLSRAKAETAAEAAASKAVSEFLQNDLLAQADPDQQIDREIKLRTVLDRAARKIDGRFPNQPLVEADVRATLATTLYSLGELAAARAHWERVRALRQQALGADHPKTLSVGVAIFNELRREGKFAEAEALALDVTDTARRVLGPDHRLTLTATGDLALVYTDAGKNVEAERLYRELLPHFRRVFGEDDPNTFVFLNNLGLAYRRLDRLEDAERCYREALAGRRRVLGDDHRSTITTMHNLSALLAAQSRFEEARTLNAEVIERRRRLLGEDHPSTLLATAGLALLHWRMGDWATGEDLLLKNLKMRKRKLGAEHPDVLLTEAYLASIYRERGKLADALALASEAAVGVRRRLLGPEHPYTIAMMTVLAEIDRDAGRLDDAHRIAAEGLAISGRVRGPNHSDTRQLQRVLGSILLREGSVSEAEPLLRQFIQSSGKSGPNSLSVAAAKNHLGQALLALGRADEAEPLLLESHATLTKAADRIPPGDRHEIDEAAANLAHLYRVSNRLEKARAWEKQIAVNGSH